MKNKKIKIISTFAVFAFFFTNVPVFASSVLLSIPHNAVINGYVTYPTMQAQTFYCNDLKNAYITEIVTDTDGYGGVSQSFTINVLYDSTVEASSTFNFIGNEAMHVVLPSPVACDMGHTITVQLWSNVANLKNFYYNNSNPYAASDLSGFGVGAGHDMALTILGNTRYIFPIMGGAIAGQSAALLGGFVQTSLGSVWDVALLAASIFVVFYILQAIISWFGYAYYKDRGKRGRRE